MPVCDLGAAPKPGTDRPSGPDGKKPNGHDLADDPVPAVGARRKSPLACLAKPILAADQSAVLRDRLLAELEGLQSTDEAASWAYRSLPAKDALTAADAELVETGFRAKLVAFDAGQHEDGLPAQSVPYTEERPTTATETLAHVTTVGSGLDTANAQKVSGELSNPASGVGGGIDKSVLEIGEPRRLRDKEHRKFVSAQACLICGRQPSDPHHLRLAQPRALGRKVSDEFMVPLCRIHHRESHRAAEEAAWWERFGIDPYRVAAVLWAKTRPVRSVAEPRNDNPLMPPSPATSGPAPMPSLPDGPQKCKTKPIVAMTQ
jgi:hypothetical protein